MKKTVKPSTMVYPVPAVMVSCADQEGNPNIITIAWAGNVCSDPPMASISIRPSRYSHQLIKQSGEFVINIPKADQLAVVDKCGVISGRQVNKFEACGLTPMKASVVKAPLIKECPVNIECVVKQVLELGAHDLFLAEVVACHIDEDCLNEKGRPEVGMLKPIAYNAMGAYWGVDRELGWYGKVNK